MKNRSIIFEKGQSIILIALVFLALVAMLALVLDGGNIYVQRRAAQVAADAGALAGARHLCGDDPDFSRATSDAITYAEEENPPNMGEISAAISFPDGNIQVDTTIVFDPFFAQVIGFNDLNTSATAVAGCESPSTGRIMPLTWTCPPPPPPSETPLPGEEGEEQFCFYDFLDCDPDVETCELPLYVFMNWDNRVCINPPNSLGQPEWIEGDVDCDWDNDGTDDAFVGSSNRGWLNLNDGENSSDIDLRNKVRDACENDISSVHISSHTWVPGQSGAGPPVYDAVQQFCIDKEIIVPVFDYPCGKQTNDPRADCNFPSPPHPTDDYIIARGAADYFHIIGFASFTITCVHSGPQDRVVDAVTFPGGEVEDGSICEGRNTLQLQNPDQFGPSDPMTIEGYLSFQISPNVGGSGGVDTGTYIIYLLE